MLVSSACLLNEVTNPRQNENQELTSLCDRVDREGDTEVSIVARMNIMTGRRWRKKKEAKWLARTLKPEVVPFSSEELGIKNFSF